MQIKKHIAEIEFKRDFEEIVEQIRNYSFDEEDITEVDMLEILTTICKIRDREENKNYE